MKENSANAFTLIELLIVMAILGLLAVIALVVMNPGERQAQAKDSGRISSVVQIGKSLQAFYTTKTRLPDVSNWADDLVTSSELSTFPSGIRYTYNSVTACTTYAQPAVDGTFCYDEDQVNDRGAIVFAKAESSSYRSKCTAPEEAYFAYSTVDGRGGTICSDGDPAPWASGTMTYQP